MAYKRTVAAQALCRGDTLTRRAVGIGILFAAAPEPNPNIEDTLVAASVEGMEHEDLRMLALLMTWLDAHHPWINADRLVHAVGAEASVRVHAFWAAVAQWQAKDRRFSRLRAYYDGPRIDVLPVGTEFQVQRHGEDRRLEGTNLRVPDGVLRDRKEDVLAPAALAKTHRGYHWRVVMGPSYRADMWAALELDSSLSPAQLARRTYGSFATAWQVKRDFGLVEGSHERA